ncbi:MAG TPA: hypothetical protein VGG07_21175 [Solirubrobacteraceae bacterium]
MIGWVILVAVLVPALVLGRWADRERRRAGPRVRAEGDPVVHVAPRRRRTHAPTRGPLRARAASRPSPRARA